ncbi:MAG TPA: hypothetical protein VNO79_09760 [Actinomycetota bacterium]|nr:hypothetical protein [Actinomycetota bacterium]
MEEQFGRPSSSAVAMKNMSRDPMNAASWGPMESWTSLSSILSARRRVSNRSWSVLWPS